MEAGREERALGLREIEKKIRILRLTTSRLRLIT